MRYGLIGSEISGSRSPELFRAAYDGRFPYDLLDGAEFLPLWKRFLEDYQAVNVTAPFKQDAFAQGLQLARDGYAGMDSIIRFDQLKLYRFMAGDKESDKTLPA